MTKYVNEATLKCIRLGDWEDMGSDTYRLRVFDRKIFLCKTDCGGYWQTRNTMFHSARQFDVFKEENVSLEEAKFRAIINFNTSLQIMAKCVARIQELATEEYLKD